MEPIVHGELDKETLERLYVQERMSLRSIAKLYGHSYPYVRYRKEKYGIPTRIPIYQKKDISRKTLFKLIVEEGKSFEKTAKQLSCSAVTVSKRCDEYGIQPKHERLKEITKADLQKFYDAEGKSMRAVAKELGCSFETVRNRCKQFGIRVRSPRRNKIEIPKSSLRRLYLKEGKNLSYIAKKFRCSISTISKRLTEYKMNRHQIEEEDD